MWYALLILVVLGIQVTWTSHRIRRELGELGMRVYRVRWLPFARFFGGRWSRRHMIYRAWYSDPRGAQLTCLAVATVFGGLAFEEQREERGAKTAWIARLPLAQLPWTSAACATLACVVLGLRYWTASYRELQLPSSLIRPELALVVALAGWLQFVQPRRWLGNLAILALAPVATVVVRIAVDVARDPTSHNLFPFELALAGFVGVLAAGLGVGLGMLASRFWSSAASA
jgi:hypothetical protein